jgi:hypothetical protein
MKLTGSSSIEIVAPLARCHDALLDFDAYHEWFPGVKESALVSGPGEAPTGRLLFSAGGMVPDVRCTLRYESRAHGQLQPHSLEGELSIRGPGWRLTEVDEARTLVSYEVELEMPVPGGLFGERALRGPATRYLLELPVQRLKRWVEGLPPPA